MGYKKLLDGVFVILLIISISACAANTASALEASLYDAQEIAPAIITPNWEQVNLNGFGDAKEREVSALEAFNGYLYAGTYNLIEPTVIFDGARIFRSSNGVTWTAVTQPGFQNPHDTAAPAILDFVLFGNRLYASTGRGGNPAQIWRSSTGAIWAPMVNAGFGDPEIHDIPALAVYNGMIYAGAGSQVSGAKIFRSSSGDSNTWNPVTPAASTMAGASVTGFEAFNGALYATVESEAPVQIWRSSSGSAWTSVMNDGFGNSHTSKTGGMAVFGGNLYVGAGNAVNGAQLWRSTNGTSWAPVITPGFGDPNNQAVEMVSVFQNELYVGVQNSQTGIEIWRSADGNLWEQVNGDGFGDGHNAGTNGSSATAVFLGQLYAGTSNTVTGGELWRTIQQNNPPTDISLSNSTVAENQPMNTVVGTLTATDPDAGELFTFSLACAATGADEASFNISGGNLRSSSAFDFETRSTYNICIRVTDQTGLTFDKNFIITVNNVNEPPTDISLSITTVDENQPVNTIVGALAATDPDAGATFTFSLACTNPGADDGAFNIWGTNLRTSAPFDFEARATYTICIRVTDQGELIFDKNFAVTVNNVNEAPTDIALSNSTVNENQPPNTVVSTLHATDPDSGPAAFTFSLTCTAPGVDDVSFNIQGTNLQTSAIFDFETKSTYSICIRVTDQGGLFFDENFVITVNNLGENTAPTDISLSHSAVDENQPINTMVGLLSATDPDAGDTFTYSLTCATPGVDDVSFNIQGANLQTSAWFDFEAKSSYNICIRVTDQSGLSFDKSFVITVNDLIENAAPTDISLSRQSVTENQPINTVVGSLTATDPDAGETFTFSLECAGADNSFFNLLGTNLRTSAVFDFESKSIYNICIRVVDQSGLSFEENFVINVKDQNDIRNSPGKVTGAGNIGSDAGKDKITFGFTIQFKKGDTVPKGNLTYQDHGTDLRLKATSFELLKIEGNHAWFTGVGVVNDGRVVSFTVEIGEFSKLGQPDTFYIQIPELDGYEAGGSLTGGNLMIH